MSHSYSDYGVPDGVGTWEDHLRFQLWWRDQQKRKQERRGLLDELHSNIISTHQPQSDGYVNFNGYSTFDGGENRPLADVGDKEAVIPYDNLEFNPAWSDVGNGLNQPTFDNQYPHIPSQDFSLSVPMDSQGLQQPHEYQAPQDYVPPSFPQNAPLRIPELEQLQPYYTNGNQPVDPLSPAQMGISGPTNDMCFPDFYDANGQMSGMSAPGTFPTMAPTGNYYSTQFENPMSYPAVPPAAPFDLVYDPRLDCSAIPLPAPVHAAGPVFAPNPVAPLPDPLLAAQPAFVQEPPVLQSSSQLPSQYGTRASVKRKRDDEASADAFSYGSAPHASSGDSETVDTSSSQPRKKKARTAVEKSKTVVKKAAKKASSSTKKPRVSRIKNTANVSYSFNVGTRSLEPLTEDHIHLHRMDEETRAATTWRGRPLPLNVPIYDLHNVLVRASWTPKEELKTCGFEGCNATPAAQEEEGEEEEEKRSNWLKNHIRGTAHLDTRLMCLICGYSGREDNFRQASTGKDYRHGMVCLYGEKGRPGMKRHPLFLQWRDTPDNTGNPDTPSLAEVRRANALHVAARRRRAAGL